MLITLLQPHPSILPNFYQQMHLNGFEELWDEMDTNVHAHPESFTADLQQLVAWLTQCNVTSVAMESTGVYWIPIFQVLEAQGFEVIIETGFTQVSPSQI